MPFDYFKAGGVCGLSLDVPERNGLRGAEAGATSGALFVVVVLAWPYGPPNHHDQCVCVSPPMC